MQDQKREKKFVSGLYLSEGPAHLEWLPYKLGIKVDQFKEFLDQNKNEKGYVNIDIKIGQNSHYCEFFSSNSIISDDLVNKDELFQFIKKKPFDNRSDFQYYPFKLFQEVLINE